MSDAVKLQLDLLSFEASVFQPYLARCDRSGLRFTTVAETGDVLSSHRCLYELNRTCSADIPGRGEFYTFEQYLAQRVNVPSYTRVASYSPSTTTRGSEWLPPRYIPSAASPSVR